MFKKHALIISSFLLMTLLLSTTGYAQQTQNSGEGHELEVGDVNIVPLQENGPPEERINLVIFGDGYTADEMDKFHEDVDRNQNVQWSVEPFRSYRNYFNVYMVETPSSDSGISCDPDDENVRRDTVFNLEYANNCPADELARGITYGDGGADTREEIIRDNVAPELGISADAQNIQTLAIANTFTYGGIGGVHATTSGGSPQGPLISLHELGHSLGNLQDEYPYWDRDVPGNPHGHYEPDSIHHTRLTSEEMIEQEKKWWRWLGEESKSGGLIRAADPDGYESGAYSSSGVWRPSEHSMMRWIGFYFDQIGREHMTQRITGMRDAQEMPLSSTPEGEVGPDDVVWVQTMHPRFHMLDVTWKINNETIDDTTDSRYLDLADSDVEIGDTVKVTVQDRTEFVRDPNYLDGPRMTQTKEWTIGKSMETNQREVTFTNHSSTEYALAHDEVVFVETSNPNDRIFEVTWNLNGEEIADTNNSRHLDLNKYNLPDGASDLSASVIDPENPDGDADTISWTVDNAMPTAPRTLSEPLTTLSGEVEHNVYFNEFDMLLEPNDDQPGFVVGEFRLNNDGWFNYFGFPEEAEGTPFNFSHSGTDIKALTYGNLGTGGLSKAAFEQNYTANDPGGPFIPGFGTHTVEHRAIDAAGNIGEADEFQATVLPGKSLECTNTITGKQNGRLVVNDGVTCIEEAQIRGSVVVDNNASLVVSDSSINGGVHSDNAKAIQLFGSTVNGKTAITDTDRDVTLAGNTLNGGLKLTDNDQASTNEQFGDYGPIVAGNTINGQLACSGNSSDVTDFDAPNDIKNTKGKQCQNLN